MNHPLSYWIEIIYYFAAEQDKAIAFCYKLLSSTGVSGRLRVAREVGIFCVTTSISNSTSCSAAFLLNCMFLIVMSRISLHPSLSIRFALLCLIFFWLLALCWIAPIVWQTATYCIISNFSTPIPVCHQITRLSNTPTHFTHTHIHTHTHTHTHTTSSSSGLQFHSYWSTWQHERIHSSPKGQSVSQTVR